MSSLNFGWPSFLGGESEIPGVTHSASLPLTDYSIVIVCSPPEKISLRALGPISWGFITGATFTNGISAAELFKQ